MPSHFIINLYTEIRNYANKKAVSGVLAIADQTFVLMLEGENKLIAGLVRFLNMDSRVMDVSVVANYRIEDHPLAEWKIRIIKPEATDRNKLLGTICDKLQGHLETHKPCDQHRLQQFFQAAGYPVPSSRSDRTHSPLEI